MRSKQEKQTYLSPCNGSTVTEQLKVAYFNKYIVCSPQDVVLQINSFVAFVYVLPFHLVVAVVVVHVIATSCPRLGSDTGRITARIKTIATIGIIRIRLMT